MWKWLQVLGKKIYFPLTTFMSCENTHMHDESRVEINSLFSSLKNFYPSQPDLVSQDAVAFSQVTLWLASSSLCPRILSAPRGWPYLALPSMLCSAPSSNCISAGEHSCHHTQLYWSWELAVWPRPALCKKHIKYSVEIKFTENFREVGIFFGLERDVREKQGNLALNKHLGLTFDR